MVFYSLSYSVVVGMVKSQGQIDMKFRRMTIRVPEEMYEKILAYKVAYGTGTMTETMNLLWQKGLEALLIADILAEIKDLRAMMVPKSPQNAP